MAKAVYYAWGNGGEWEAICVDFDISVQGDSLEEVRRELRDAVETFRDYVDELPASERERFLNRKSPLGLRLRLELAYFSFQLLRWFGLQSFWRPNAEFVKTPVA